tara:strand:+ start:154 stop:393 length:240 start_codon:yes stop_codon:yes gene_type:complete
MSDRRIKSLENNLNEARKLISVMQSKIAKQREVIDNKEKRIATMQVDKQSMKQQLNDYRDKKPSDYHLSYYKKNGDSYM